MRRISLVPAAGALALISALGLTGCSSSPADPSCSLAQASIIFLDVTGNNIPFKVHAGDFSMPKLLKAGTQTYCSGDYKNSGGSTVSIAALKGGANLPKKLAVLVPSSYTDEGQSNIEWKDGNELIQVTILKEPSGSGVPFKSVPGISQPSKTWVIEITS